MTDSGYRPPEPAGSPSRTRTPLAVLIVALLVLAIGALVVTAGILLFRVLAAADNGDDGASRSTPASAEPDGVQSGRVELSEPLEIKIVSSAEPGACPEGSEGFTTPDPVECLRLGGGFAVTELVEVSTGMAATQNVVNVTFTPADAGALSTFTRDAVGNRIALVYRDELIMAPTVQDPIEGGMVMISGNFTADEAEELAARLRGD